MALLVEKKTKQKNITVGQKKCLSFIRGATVRERKEGVEQGQKNGG